MRAVVMAGGEGTRLRPLTSTVPKPLLPVVNRPLMEHTLIWLRRQGITDVVVTVQYLGGMVRTYFDDGSELGMSLSYAVEERPLGTAGSVRNAASALRDQPFVVVSGDALTDIDLRKVIDFHRSRRALVTVVLSRVPNPLEFGIVVTEEDGSIVRLLEKPTWGQVFSDTVNTGIYVMEPKVLDRVASDRPTDWSRHVFPALLRAGEPLYGYVAEGYWEDVGSHQSYQRVHADVLDRKVQVEIEGFEVSSGLWVAEGGEVHRDATITGPAYVGPYARVEADATIREYTVLGSNVVVKAGAMLQRVIAHDNCYFGSNTNLRGCVVGRGTSVLRGAVIEEGAVLGDSCTVEEDVFVAQDVRVYPHKIIEAGSVLTSSVIWQERGGQTVFGPQGVSGLVNVEITPETVTRMATAYAATLGPDKTVVVGRDVSRAARSLKRVAVGALTASGVTVSDVEVSPVPVTRFLVSAGADGGLQLRTSPGDPERLDIAFLDPRGADLSDTARRRIERAFNRGEFRRVLPRQIADLRFVSRRFDLYSQALLASVDMRGIADAGLKIVVDASGGAASLVLPVLLGAIPAEVLTVDLRLDETRPTESLPDRMRAMRRLGDLVSGSRAAFGVRIDPMGERLSLVDEKGVAVSDGRAMLAVADLVASERHYGVVAVPVTATRMIDQVARYHGVGVRRTSTAPHQLARASAAQDCVFAADGRGGFIVPRFTPFLDAVATFVSLVGLVARTRLTLSQIDDRIPGTETVRRSVPTPWAARGAVMRRVLESAYAVPDAWVDTTDGVRLNFGESSAVTVIPDATEAATLVQVESPEIGSASELMATWTATVEDAISGAAG